jgi:hypothetical protein
MLAPLQADDLKIEPLEATGPPSVRLVWRGRSGARNPGEVLSPYFREVLSAAAGQGLPVEMHFQHLEHFNSSTVAALIHLIQNARAKNVPMVFVYDQALKWQKLSFDAMRVFVKSDGLLQMRSIS